MERILAAIDNRAVDFARHPLLQRLERGGTIEALAAFSAGLSPWVVAFQDILRICDETVTEQLPKEIARCIRLEDRGHDAWYFEDLETLSALPSLSWVNGPGQAPVREACYQLVSEMHRASSDLVRVAVLVVLETTGSAFFSRVANYVERAGYVGDLKYFHKSHLAAEEDHSLWTSQEAQLKQLPLTDELHDECSAAVERCFEAFVRILNRCEELAAQAEAEAIGSVIMQRARKSRAKTYE